MMKLKGGHIMLWPKKLASSLALFFALLVVWIQGATIFSSGLLDRQGNLIFSNYVLFHDSNVHLSLIAELSHRFPPTDFAIGGGRLNNYHYLFDVAVTLLNKLTGISTLDLYFRIVPIVLSLILCFVIYKTIFALSKNRFAAAFGIFLTVFSTSWGAWMPFFKQIFGGNSVGNGSNIFMTDQLINMLVNPQGQLSIIIFLTLFLLLHQYETKKSSVSLIGYSLILGLSFGVKAYGGLIFAPAALISSVVFLIKNRDSKVLLATFIGLSIMAIWILKTIDQGVAGMKLAPFWLLDHMMGDLDKINEPRFLLLKEHYQSVGSWWHLILLNLFAVFVYLVGSLGPRLIGFLAMPKIFSKLKAIPLSLIFLITSSLFSLGIPIFFNQTKKAYDVVQFTPYFTVFMGIMFTLGLFMLLERISYRLIRVGVMTFVVVFLLILNKGEISSRFEASTEKIVIPKPVVAATTYINNQTPKDAIFLLAPSEFNRSYLWFTSLAGRRTAFSGLDFAFQVGEDQNKLITRWERLFQGDDNHVHFDYVFLPKSEEEFFGKIKRNYSLSTVYQNDQVQILKRIK